MSHTPSALELLLVHLTKREFSLVWSVDQLRDSEEYADEFANVDTYATPGFQSRGDLYVERFRRTIRYLTAERDFQWTWLEPNVETGSIRRIGEGLEPGNAAYEAAMAMAQVDYEVNTKRAALLAEEKGHERLARVLYDAAENISETVRARIAEADPEVFRQFAEQNDELLSSLGVERVQKDEVN
jgi:hypothetical protein